MRANYRWTLFCAAAFSALSGVATAQEAAALAPASDEVVVTAQRRSESILSVPLAVSALSSETLERAGVTQTSDLAALVPNLQINSA